MKVNVRPAEREDFTLIADYFTENPDEYWVAMGVDPKKLPGRATWIENLEMDFTKPLEEKAAWFLIWEHDDLAIGHSNVNKIAFSEEAEMHLHLWQSASAQKGLGTELLRRTIPIYFEELRIKNLFCQPYAFNVAPNKLLPKMGFKFLKKYRPTPVGWIHLDDEMNRYVLTRETFDSMEAFFTPTLNEKLG